MPVYNKQTAYVPKGYKAWWSFNEQQGLLAPDRDFNYVGTLHSDAMWSPISKKGRGSIHGNGVDYISLATGQNIFNITRSFTSCFFVYLSEIPTDAERVLCLNFKTSPTAGNNSGLSWYLVPNNGTAKIEFRVRQSMSTAYGVTHSSRGAWQPDIPLNTGEWNLIFCQRSNTDASAYVYNSNGLQSDNLDLGGSYPLDNWSNTENQYNNNIGIYNTTQNGFEQPITDKTYINEMALWDREISQAERDFIWNNSNGKVPPVAKYKNYITSTSPYNHFNEISKNNSLGLGYQQLILSQSPLIYLPLTETTGTTVFDISGNSYNGMLQGSATLGATTLARDTGPSVDLNGTTDFIEVDPSSNSIIGSGSFSINIWFRIDAITGMVALVSYNDTATVDTNGGENIFWARINSDRLFGITYNTGGVTSIDALGTTVLSLDTPYMYTCVYDSTADTFRLYLNGVEEFGDFPVINVSSTRVKTPTDANTLTIGQEYDLDPFRTSNWLNGKVQHFSLYNSPLQSGDIFSLYKTGQLGNHYKILDESTNSRNGFLAFNSTVVYNGVQCIPTTKGCIQLGDTIMDNQILMAGSQGTLIFSFTPHWDVNDGITHDLGSKGFNDDVWFCQKNADNSWYIGFIINGVDYRHAILSSAFNVIAGSSYRLAFVWGADSSQVYVNGFLISSNSLGGATPNYTTASIYDDLTLGSAEYDNGTYPLNSADCTIEKIVYYSNKRTTVQLLQDAKISTAMDDLLAV